MFLLLLYSAYDLEKIWSLPSQHHPKCPFGINSPNYFCHLQLNQHLLPSVLSSSPSPLLDDDDDVILMCASVSPGLDQLADTGGCTQWGYSFHQSSLPVMPCQFDRYNGDFLAHAHLLTYNHPPLGWQDVLDLSGVMVSSLFKFCSAYICSPLYACAYLLLGSGVHVGRHR